LGLITFECDWYLLKTVFILKWDWSAMLWFKFSKGR
jgi:hypothetical protein